VRFCRSFIRGRVFATIASTGAPLPLWLNTCLVGLCVGLIGLFFPKHHVRGLRLDPPDHAPGTMAPATAGS
jgi:hypothetical protein